ncbi:MAG: alpha/beta fold hydrolase [Bacteroidota bacterium]|nr:alpha/beta fold hydrolase [Bacteroidota bacterium]
MKLTQRIFLAYYIAKFRAIEVVSPVKAAKAAFQLFTTPYSTRRTYAVPDAFKHADRLSFSFEQHQIHGFTWKPKVPNGHKVLICHGFDSLSYRFERYIEPLLHQGFEIYAFDAPGHGLSTGKTINALLYSNMILEIFNKFGPFNGIISHSFGGIAVTIAIEKMKDNLPKRLVLIAPATETTRSINDFCRHLKISPRVRRMMENIILQLGGQPPSWYSVSRIVQSFSIPTLWLHDIKDRITPYEDMKHLTKMNLSHIEFMITEGLGHSLYRNDEVANKIIGFLVTLKNNIY